MYEFLERRLLLTGSLVNGKLTLTTNWFPETFTVTSDASNIIVTIAVEQFNAAYPKSLVNGLIINAVPVRSLDLPGDSITINSSVTLPTTVNGSNGDDVITAGSGPTLVNAGEGADLITGGAGNDTINAGDGREERDMIPPGDDTLIGGPGNDLLKGEGSPQNLGDSITGDLGDDTIIGGEGADTMDGGGGVNTLSYEDKDDDINIVFPNPPNPFYDPMNPDPDDPEFQGQGETEIRQGLRVVAEHDNVVESSFTKFIAGAGDDIVSIDNQVDVSVTIFGGAGVDELLGDEAGDLIDGGEGSVDSISGLGGNDTLLGGPGNDTIDGGDGNDLIFGDDSLAGAGAGNDTLDGNAGADTIDGGNGNDLLTGGADNDFFPGGAPTNGADTLQGDAGFDTADYSTRTKAQRISFDDVHDDGDPSANAGLGERDFVTETTEAVLAGSGNDILSSTFDSVSRRLVGNSGKDTITAAGGNDTLEGGDGDDSLSAGLGADVISGGAGKDTLDYSTRTIGVNVSTDGAANDGQAGESDNVTGVETVLGGSGGDNLNLSTADASTPVSLIGNGGNDTLAGGAAKDTIDGGAGDDVISGNGGTDTLTGGIGNDQVSGDAGNDTITGDDGNDTLTGGDDNDTITGGAGNDSLDGGNGADTLDGGTGSDAISGGTGSDLVSYSDRTADLSLTLDGIANDGAAGELDNLDVSVDMLLGGSGADLIAGGAASSNPYVFYGNGGNDTLVGGLGADRLVGGGGNDSLAGGAGNDTLLGSRGKDTMSGGADSDLVSYYYESTPVIASLDGVANDGLKSGEGDFLQTDIENLDGGQAKDTLTGSDSANRLRGLGGNDLLQGLGGKDILEGGEGSDTLNGGGSNDTLRGDAGPDRFIGGTGTDMADYRIRTDNLFLSLDDLTNDGASGEGDKLDLDIERLFAGSGNDRITGSSRNETLDGGLGLDTITGGGGADVIQNA